MSEKRFTYDKPIVAFSKGGINDNVTGETYEFTMDTVLDLLNKQQDNIHELQSIINHIKCEENCEDYDYCCETVCSLYNEIKHLKEENRELRQSVEYWQKKYEEGTETFQIN